MKGVVGKDADHINPVSGRGVHSDPLCEKKQRISADVRTVHEPDAGDLRGHDLYCQKRRDLQRSTAIFVYIEKYPASDPVFSDHTGSAWVSDRFGENSVSHVFIYAGHILFHDTGMQEEQEDPDRYQYPAHALSSVLYSGNLPEGLRREYGAEEGADRRHFPLDHRISASGSDPAGLGIQSHQSPLPEAAVSSGGDQYGRPDRNLYAVL